MDYLKKAIFAIILLTGYSASAQSFKQEIKKAYLETCLKAADTIEDSYQQRLYRWWCDCSAEKVSNHFGMADFLKLRFMDKNEAAQKIADVIRPCTDEVNKNTKKYNELKKRNK